jgi:hypothetical protein
MSGNSIRHRRLLHREPLLSFQYQSGQCQCDLSRPRQARSLIEEAGQRTHLVRLRPLHGFHNRPSGGYAPTRWPAMTTGHVLQIRFSNSQDAASGPHGSRRACRAPHHEDLTDLILRSGVGVYHRAALCADPLAASRRMGSRGNANTRLHSRDAIRPGFAFTSHPLQQRAQGMPGARCARSLACSYETKHTSIVTTGSPETPGIPRAMVLTVSFVLSPVSQA